MTKYNTKRIEETATNSLKAALLRCPILDSYIFSNDKTPSWDGNVHVYKNEIQKKENLLGRAPIQIKGTEKRFVSTIVSYSCGIADLNNYYRDGGCIFFLISVNTSTGDATIYYSSLHVYDLKKYLDDAGSKKSITLKLKKFPQEDANEIASIFLSFVQNSRKQMSFIGKEILSLEQLESSGVNIESLTFGTYGIGLELQSIGSFISTHDFYLYAKPKGLDIEIPVDKISNAIISKPVFGKVLVKNTEYFPLYYVIFDKGSPSLRIGKGINCLIDQLNNRITLNYKPVGTLSDFIRDASCFIDIIENHEVTLKNATLHFDGNNFVDLNKYKTYLQYYKDVKKMLDLLGVTEELKCESISDNDEKNIRNFVNAILYNRTIGFQGASDAVIHGAFKIANLSIWIWATRQENGNYKLSSFFDSHDITIFDKGDRTQSNPIPASHFLLLNKHAFIHASNLDIEAVKEGICSMKRHHLLIDHTTWLMLRVLLGYDEQSKKDDRLLDLAETICKWLAPSLDNEILRLNQLQIEKRRRTLKTKEKIELGKFTDEMYPDDIRCGAYLLLDDSTEAQKCFNQLPSQRQKEFIDYPICHFGRLIQEEKQ